jgi:hypothetical protein
MKLDYTGQRGLGRTFFIKTSQLFFEIILTNKYYVLTLYRYNAKKRPLPWRKFLSGRWEALKGETIFCIKLNV